MRLMDSKPIIPAEKESDHDDGRMSFGPARNGFALLTGFTGVGSDGR